MTSPHLVLGIARDTGHAVPDGQLVALCGVPVDATVSLPYPGGASSLCRDCSRAAAVAASSTGAPLRGLGGVKRPGGM